MSRLIRSAGVALLFLAVACERAFAPHPEPGAIGARSGSSNVTPIDPTGNGAIVFSSLRDGLQSIYIMNPDGSNQTLLKQAPNAGDRLFDPVWSPDGTKIAYIVDVWDVYLMNADGTGEVQLTNDLIAKQDLAWSPDGTRIAYANVASTNPDYGINVINTDGSGQSRIFASDELPTGPAWSPDGSKIAFSMATDATALRIEIFVINADGTGLVQLTNDGGTNSSPAWSPDGSRIAFASTAGFSGGMGALLTIMNADGSDRTILAPGTHFFDWNPVWSPDGRMIAFQRTDFDGDDDTGIYVINADGTGLMDLTPATTTDFMPSWGPRRLTTMADCMNGKWMNFGFPNQGQCIKYLNRP